MGMFPSLPEMNSALSAWSKCPWPRKIASGCRSTRSWMTNGVRPGITSRRVTNESSRTTRPFTATAYDELVNQEMITRSRETWPVTWSTCSAPKNLLRAAIVAGSPFGSARTAAASVNTARNEQIESECIRFAMTGLLLGLEWGASRVALRRTASKGQDGKGGCSNRSGSHAIQSFASALGHGVNCTGFLPLRWRPLAMWKFAVFAAAGLSLAWGGRREAPANVSGPMDGAGQSKSRQQAVVAVTAIGDPSGLLERDRSSHLARQVQVALEGDLGTRGTEILSLAAAAPCTAACLSEAKARSAGEVLEVSVERRPETLAVVLRRIRTRTGREYGSVATRVGSDGDVPNLAHVLSKLFPPPPYGVRLGEEDGGIAPAFARAAAPPQPFAPPRPVERTASAATARPDRQRIADLVREVQREVEAVRGIRSPRPLRVEVLDDGGFERALRRSIRSGTRKLVAARLAKWIAFGIAPNGVDPEEAEEHAQLGAGLLGFYDPATRRLYVRRDQAGESEEEKDRMLRRVVAHEIEHALQDQAFHLANLLQIADDETRLALKALYEGEATAVETAWEAREKHLPVRFVVAEEAAARKRLDDEASLQANGYSGSVRDAPLILQEELVLQYVHGFALVAEVLKNGGLRSVDQMFRNPPRTTAQVSNPALYFGGQMPLAVARPEAPRGTRVVSAGSMGALGTRVALQVCGDPSIAASVAADLAGDAYEVVERRDGSLGVLWNTAWTKPEDATRFATMIDLQKPCWETSTLDSPKHGWRISAEYSVRVSGTQVAFVRGFGPGESVALASRAATFTVGGSRSGGPRLAGAEGFRNE